MRCDFRVAHPPSARDIERRRNRGRGGVEERERERERANREAGGGDRNGTGWTESE